LENTQPPDTPAFCLCGSASAAPPSAVPVVRGVRIVLKYYKQMNQLAPYISVNCAALPENLIEAELFGVEKGAYTGADKTRKGLFELADGGTLLLDEIGELPVHIQSKLLGVLDEKNGWENDSRSRWYLGGC